PIGRVPDPGQLLQARRTAAAGGSQRLVFLAIRFLLDPFADTGDLLVWDPDLSRAQFIGAGLGLRFHDLGAATGSAALVSSLFRTGGQGTTRLPLDPTQAPTVLPHVERTQRHRQHGSICRRSGAPARTTSASGGRGHRDGRGALYALLEPVLLLVLWGAGRLSQVREVLGAAGCQSVCEPARYHALDLVRPG